jgi:hypothetical protein
MKAPFRTWHALFAFVGVGGLSVPLLYELAILVSPPFAADGRHRVMPIGQVVFALAFAPVTGAMAAWIAGRRGERTGASRKRVN